ncbi:resuscitation-promoting factor [Jonesia quinghaiensis]|uniref:resuscitation-promoting factor n=1 Tax=Jonesia quinghaiensis TaxID=262806 RepID=UPI0006858F29|nr:resuscitation-promoting factor [Jonesia quinghaiensis]
MSSSRHLDSFEEHTGQRCNPVRSFAVPGYDHVWNSVKKPVALALTGALTTAMIAGGAVYASAHKTITLDVDGNVETFTTFAGSVDSLLEDKGVALDSGDVVAPASTASLSEGDTVTVRYQREVTLDNEGEEITIKTTALDANELLTTYALRGDDVTLVASRSDERLDVGLRLDQDGPVAIVVDGENIVTDGGHGLVSDILAAQGIEVGEEDRVSIQHLPEGTTSVVADDEEGKELEESALDVAREGVVADGVVSIVVQRVETTTKTKKTDIDFKTVTKKDSTRFEDLPKVVQSAGKKGERVRKYEIVTVDGVVESKEKIYDEVEKKAKKRVVVVGTKERPAPTPAPKATSSSSSGSSSPGSSSSGSSSSGSSDSSSSGSSTVSGDVWSKLAQCESGGNPSIVSSNGLYHGLYQFSVSTWKSVGGSGLPSQASAAEQTKRAKMLQARSGWGQWPHCSSKLGLR